MCWLINKPVHDHLALSYPSVELISSDRNSEYAHGEQQEPSHALQVEAIFHLVRNLAEVAERILSLHRMAIKHIRLIMPAASLAPLAVSHMCHDRVQCEAHQHQVRLESYIR